jgi:glutamate-1-semialdehyde 2,1-aminomutase
MTKKNNKISSEQMWQDAQHIIPGGNGFFSKRPEQFLVGGGWPAYYERSKGCEIWTKENTKYVDMALMGVGTCTLGYANDEVDSAVINAIGSGVMSSLNCPEEFELAEKLVHLNPWSDMVRFTKSGGEANAVAIRIARSAAKSEKIAVCGYHGWHDWYLASNLNNSSSLNEHLMTGLFTSGVPKALAGSIFPFIYNDLEQLVRLIDEENIGIVKMEVQRNIPPKDNFLKDVRDLCTKHGIVLIFDECTSGFRQNLGGLHLTYNVYPDIAMYGKAMANGHAICAVVGREDFMKHANNSFISSTFWSERSGYVAALKTLEVMERIKSYDIISSIGKKIKKSWLNLASTHNLNIKIRGLDALCGFNFESDLDHHYKSFITESMLSYDILATNTIYTCIAHTDDKLEYYFDCLDKCFNEISKRFPDETLHDQMSFQDSASGFHRLN